MPNSPTRLCRHLHYDAETIHSLNFTRSENPILTTFKFTRTNADFLHVFHGFNSVSKITRTLLNVTSRYNFLSCKCLILASWTIKHTIFREFAIQVTLWLLVRITTFHRIIYYRMQHGVLEIETKPRWNDVEMCRVQIFTFFSRCSHFAFKFSSFCLQF